MTLASRMRNHALGLGALLGLSVATTLVPARACTRAFTAITASYPDGYSGERVPTNAVLFVDGPALTAADFTLSDAAGNAVAIQARAVEAGGFDIEPLAELAPNQSYVLSVPERPDTVTHSISFSTDKGPADVPEALLVPEWAPILVSYSFGSCGNETAFCTGARRQPDTWLEVRIGHESLTGDPESVVRRALGGGLGEDDCMSIRARDIRGRRSEPAVACGDAIRRHAAGALLDPFRPAACEMIAASFAEPAATPPAPTDVTGPAHELGGGGCALRAASESSSAGWIALAAALTALTRRCATPQRESSFSRARAR